MSNVSRRNPLVARCARLSTTTRRAATVICALAVAALVPSAGEAFSGEVEPRAAIVQADPTVGALFTDAATASHNCTGTVLTAGHGLVLTAAHCLKGAGAGLRFVPGYDGTAAESAPYATWTVSKVWAASGWLAGHEAAHDFAVLKISDQLVAGVPRSIEQVTGGHSISVVPGEKGVAGSSTGPVTVVAYNAGAADAPVGCTTGGGKDPIPTSFRCGGYSTGTSGAPWMQRGTVKHPSRVVGLIGGLHQGGCSDSVSYSPTFDAQMTQLMNRAEADLPGDDIPAAGGDGCS